MLPNHQKWITSSLSGLYRHFQMLPSLYDYGVETHVLGILQLTKGQVLTVCIASSSEFEWHIAVSQELTFWISYKKAKKNKDGYLHNFVPLQKTAESKNNCRVIFLCTILYPIDSSQACFGCLRGSLNRIHSSK